MTECYLEDFEVGQMFGGSARIHIDHERIKSFAAEFDPQPFHLDENAANDSIFRGLAASRWHTAAVTIGLLVESELKPLGAWSAPASMTFAGHDRFVQAMSCASRARYSKYDLRSPDRLGPIFNAASDAVEQALSKTSLAELVRGIRKIFCHKL